MHALASETLAFIPSSEAMGIAEREGWTGGGEGRKVFI